MLGDRSHTSHLERPALDCRTLKYCHRFFLSMQEVYASNDSFDQFSGVIVQSDTYVANTLNKAIV